ncbi:hypothetical protein [Halorussus halophilus]|uniref:hypothetical protein n=1 Tax=Halorussus halophilus TaxID=2650975 RepID=UPI00130192C3|nr:hypothetical protein [Halorussus halophilus]
MPRSRRTLLKTTGLALGSGTLASIAGCLSNSSIGSDSSPESTASDSTTGNESSSDETSTSDPSGGTEVKEFVQWLPDPTSTPLHDGYGFQYFDVEGIRSYQENIHENSYSRLEEQMARRIPGEYIDETAVDAALEVGHTSRLAFGSFDPETFRERLTSDRQSSATATATQTPATTTATTTTRTDPEQYHGFDLYVAGYHVYAVSKDVVMEAAPMGRDEDAAEYAKAIIDAPSSETSQYTDSNEYVAAMMGVEDATHALWCYPEAMDGSTSRGFRKDVITGELKSWRFGTETTHLTWANTYPDAETAENGELADYIESESDRFGAYDGIDVEVEGRLAWTDGTIPTTEFDHLSPRGPGSGVTTSN